MKNTSTDSRSRQGGIAPEGWRLLRPAILAALLLPAGHGRTVMAAEAPPVEERIAQVLELEPVWSAHPVGFCLLTAPPEQYVAYYDADRRMTVAQRRLTDSQWTFTKLPSKLGWDSHNYVTMALDGAGKLHLSGNMHVNPLVYFRSAQAGEARSLRRLDTMVDPALEKRMTYPRFLRGPEDRLIFRYRNGSSGKGNDHYNLYDPETESWSALVDGPLLDGQGRMNGYFSSPRLGPDGRFHMVGVWRDTPDAATNHHPSYARSPDLRRWEKADGAPIPLPMTVDNIDVVEAVPPRQGLINGNCRLGFDTAGRPLVTYHRYDAAGNSQVYCARFNGKTWDILQISAWDGYRWDFGGGGSLPSFEVRVGGVETDDQGGLRLSFARKGERGVWLLDPDTLRILGPAPPPRIRHASLGPLASTFPGMSARSAGDAGQAEATNVRYVLRWETLGPNRDRPRDPPLPEPSMLRLYRLETGPTP
ncbi:MAG: BNR repeat-containing protein [Lentisphaeria bacterium]|nr:BNR repeat-containing protein [Lentisphaeria bacterium]